MTKEDQTIWAEYPYSYVVKSPEMKPICVTVDEDELMKLGTLVGEGEFFGALFDRIYIQVDGNMLGQGYIYGNDKGLSHCTKFIPSLPEEEHIATLYVAPFDSEIIGYSWAFAIEE